MTASTVPASAADGLRALLESFAPIPPEEWRFAERFLTEHRLTRGEHLQRAGRPVTRLCFVVDGLLRNYLLDTDGTERATGFVFSRDLAGDYNAGVVAHRPSAINIDALRPTRLVAFPPSMLTSLYVRHPCWDRIGRGIAERGNLRKEDKEHRFRRFTPEEHYHHLLVHKPHLVREVPLRHVASYLGIRPETLSRIRRRARGAGPEPGQGMARSSTVVP